MDSAAFSFLEMRPEGKSAFSLSADLMRAACTSQLLEYFFFYRVSLFKLQPAACSGVRPLLPTGSSTIRRLLDAPPTFIVVYMMNVYIFQQVIT